MKRAPIERTLAELPRGDRPPSARPMLPDRESTDTPWHGSAHDLLRRKDTKIAALKQRVADLEADAAVLAVMAFRRLP